MTWNTTINCQFINKDNTLYTSVVRDTIFILYTKVASTYILKTRAAELAEPVSTEYHYFKH